MFNRREFLGMSLGASAALALNADLLRAFEQSGGKLIERTIPSTGERLPVIGVGRGSRPADPAALKEVLKTLVDSGGKFVDTVHGGPQAQDAVGAAAADLGIQNRLFWTTPVSKAGPADVRAQVDASLGRLKVQKIDLVMLIAISTAEVAAELAVLREMKKEGKIRYIGVTDLLPPQTVKAPAGPNLETMMRNESIDFIGFDYSASDRRAEQTLLPLAQERKIAVAAYFTFDRGRIFKRVGATPVPEWAAEFGAKTWPQFFLKYVISHPAVTIARTGTANPQHMLENIAGGIGRLPDEATRKRMATLVDSLG